AERIGSTDGRCAGDLLAVRSPARLLRGRGVSSLPPGPPRWSTPWALTDHFQKHGTKPGCASVQDYEWSALDTMQVGRRFTYLDPRSSDPRVGYFAPPTGRFAALHPNEQVIYSHYIPDRGAQYV